MDTERNSRHKAEAEVAESPSWELQSSQHWTPAGEVSMIPRGLEV